MDYHSMKRRELQALCKEHNIPANSANSVMADKLSELLNEKQKLITRQRTCMKSSVETIDESEPAVSRRQAKKVRFSPNNDLVEYELQSGKKEKAMVTEMKHRRKSVAKKVDKPVVDNDNTVELIDDGVQIPIKLTRSRVQILGKDGVIPINEKKQGRRAVKDVEKGTDVVKETEGILGKVTRSKVHTLGKGGGVQLDENKQSKRAVKDVEKASESVEETVVGRVRVTRSKAQTLMEDGMGPDLNPQAKKKSGRRVAKDAENVEPSKEIVDIPVRVTRSRGQTLKDDIGNTVANPQAEKKRTRRETKVADLSNNSSNVAPEDNQELPKRKLSRTRGVEIADEDGGKKLGHGRRKKRSEESMAEVPESQYHNDKGSRQSRRNEAKVEDSTVLNHNASKVEMVDDRKVTRSKALLAMKSSRGNSKSEAENKVEVQRESKMVQQHEEPLEHAGRKNVNRRKSVMQPENTEVVLHLEEPVNRPARKDIRQKFVMQKAQGKGIDKPLVGKREMVKETGMVESPNAGTRKTVGKKQSKKQSGNLSMIDEGLDDKENVTRSGKDASENEMKAVASATGSHKSKKRRGNPIIEDQSIETVYVSPVDEFPRRSTRSASKSEGKAVIYPRQNFVAKKQQESSLKTPASRMDNQSAVESAFLEGHQRGTSQTLISGAIIGDNSSKKRAKLSGAKQSDSEDHAEKSNTEGTPVSKLGNFELDEKVTETEHTPVMDESLRRFTRSAIRSERNAVGSFLGKEPIQSAIKEQPIGDAQLSSRKVAKFRPDPAVITTPGRFTRSGIKHGGNAASKLFEKVDKKKQPSQSAHQRQPLDDSQMSSPEVAEVRPNLDVTSSTVIKKSNSRKRKESPLSVQKTIRSEISKEAKGQILEHSGDLSASESVRLPTKVVEENRVSMSEAAIVMENSGENASRVESHAIPNGSYATARALGEVMEVACARIEKSSVQFTHSAANYETSATPYLTENLLIGKQRSPVDLPNFEDETPSGTNFSDIKRTPFSMAEVAETAPDALSYGSHVQNQNQEVYVKSAIFNEAEVQVAVNSEKSVLKSARPEACEKEMELTKSGSRSKRLQTDVMVEEPVVTVGKTVVMEERVITKGNNGDADNNCDSISYEAGSSAVCHASFEQSDVKSKSKEMEASLEPSIIEGVKQFIADDGAYAQIEKGSEQDALTCKDSLQNPSVDNHEVADNGEHDDEDERAGALKQLMNEPDSEENRVHGSIDMLQSPDMGNRGVADGVDAQEMDSVVGEYVVEPNRDNTLEQSTGDDKLQGLAMDENDIKDDIVTARNSLAKHSELSTGKNVNYVLAIDRRDFADDVVDAIKEPAKELEFEVVPSTGNDVREVPILGKSDDEDGSVNDTKECETDSMLSTAAGNMLEDPVLSGGDAEDEGVNADNEHESNLKLSTDNDVSDTSLLGKDDDFSMTRQLEPISEPSTANDILETPFSGNGIDGECDNAIDDLKSYLTGNDVSGTPVMGKDDVEGINVCKELEPGLEPSNAESTLEVPVSGNNVDSECVADDKNDLQDRESEQERLKSNDSPASDEQDVGVDGPEPAQNENMPVVPEVLIRSSDQEPEPVLNVAVDKVPCDIVDVCASVGQSDSSTSKEAPQTLAASGNDVTIIRVDALEESRLDINKDAVSNILGDIDGLGNAIGVTDTKNDINFCRNEQKIIGTSELDEGVLSKESKSVSPDMSNEQRTEEAEKTTENDHALGDKKEQTVATVDHDLDSDKFMEDCSNHGVDELDSQLVVNIKAHENPTREESSPIEYAKEELSDRLVGDIGAHESPIREESLPIVYKKEESLVGDTVSDPPTSFKDDDRNKQEETQNASTTVDWGYSFGIDEFQKPVSANESDDVLDDRVSDLQISARASSSIEESTCPAADLVNSVTNLEKASRNVADGKSNQDVDMLKANANANADVTEEFFNWSDSSLKALFTTPTSTRIGHVKDGQEDAVGFAFPDDRCNEDIGRNDTAAHEFNHQWKNEPLRVFNDKTQGTVTHSLGLGEDPKNEIFGVPNFEDFSHKYFDDEEVDGSSDRSGKNEYFGFKDDQVDQIKQYDLSEAAGTSRREASGLKDNSICSREFEKNKETQLKGSETGDDLAFDKGRREM